MTGTRSWCDHVRDKLVVSRTRLWPENTYSFVSIKSGILATIAEIEEIGCRVIKKAVRIKFDFEVLNRPKGLTLENPQVTIKARYKQFVARL
jgi:hypothetical protein